MALQLCPRASMDELVDDLVTVACARVPGLPREPCRALVALMLTSRVRQTAACGRYPVCGEPASGADRQAGWDDPDPAALSAIFAASAVDLVEPRPLPSVRARLQRRLADGFRAILAPHLVVNPHCGTSEVCDAAPTWPIRLRPAR